MDESQKESGGIFEKSPTDDVADVFFNPNGRSAMTPSMVKDSKKDGDKHANRPK